MKNSTLQFVCYLNLLLCFGLASGLNAQCGSDYLYKGTYQGHAYFYSTATVSWDDANNAAIALGGHLATISSAGENSFVSVNVLGGSLAWIGLNDAASEGTFVWSNGEPFIYSNWLAGEPNNAGNEDWVEINRNGLGLWNDLPAGYPRRYVVEFETGDSDNDGLADVCDACPLDANNDADGDGVCGNVDNCPTVANTNQTDTDGDGVGNACDTDDDNDGCLDGDDANPLVFSGDSDCDGIADDCDDCNGGNDQGPCDATTFPGINNIPASWKCGNNNNKVQVCHNGNTLCISPNAVQAHLNHGDFLGPCVSCNGERSLDPATIEVQDLQLEMFPNPAAQEVVINLSGLDNSEAALTIFDKLGRVVLQKNLDEGIQQSVISVKLNEYATGEYLVRVSTNRAVVTKILIVAK